MRQQPERLGEFLVRRGVLAREAVSAILEEQRRTRDPFGQIAVRRGYLDEESLTEQLAGFTQIPLLQREGITEDADLIARVPRAMAEKLGVVPLGRGERQELVCACNGPLPMAALQSLSKLVNRPVKLQLVPASLLGKMRSEASLRDLDTRIQIRDADAMAEDVHFVAEVLEKLLLRAVRLDASDLHLEPGRVELLVRIRVDGMLQITERLPLQLQDKLVSRIKVLAELDIAEKRMPQDGAFFFRPEHVHLPFSGINIRVSSLPVVYGEKVVMRLLPSNESAIGVGELGMAAATLEVFKRMASRPHGMVLVTGPTGSGKSTTLYGLMQMLRSETTNITTLEDPVELKLPGINQTQIVAGPKISFAGALRSILRQDPDVIMVGEIRDRATIEVALQAAITGHLVLTTLHTNDAPSSFTRLVDMGAESFLVATSVLGILAQRLVRRVCPLCRRGRPVSLAELRLLGLESTEVEGAFAIQRGEGCDHCRGTGYTGRVGLFELLEMDETLKQMVAEREPAERLRRHAREQLGFRTLFEDGVEKVRQGMTTPEEILRVTMN